MNIQEEREWWEMRVKYPFVGGLQEKLDAFQERLIKAGEPVIFIPPAEPQRQSLGKSIFGFDL